MIRFDKRREIRIEGRKRLRTRPLILHDAEEIHHLVAEHGEMSRRSGRDLAGDAAQALLNQLLQGPSRAVSGQHGQIMNMNIGVSVRLRDLLVIDLGQPVVRRNRAGIGQDQSAHGISHRGILLHAPVLHLHVAVHHIPVIQNRGFHRAHFLSLLAVQNVGLRSLLIARLSQHTLHAVLNILHMDRTLFDLILKIRGHAQRQQIHNIIIVVHLRRCKRFHDRIIDLRQGEISLCTIPFDNLQHLSPSCASSVGFLVRPAPNRLILL